MSDHEYTPKSKVGKWFNDRLPLLTLANHLTDYQLMRGLLCGYPTGLITLINPSTSKILKVFNYDV